MNARYFLCILLAGSTWTGGLLLRAQEARYNSAAGVVQGRNAVGGLIGRADASASRVFDNAAAGRVAGAQEVGGFIGSNRGEIVNGYSRGQVTGTSQVGGFAGMNEGAVSGCYWDINRSGQSGSAGGDGRSTDDMTYPYAGNTYVGWNFSTVWRADVLPWQNDGYPWLAVTDVYRLDVRVFPGGAGEVSGAGYYKAGSSAPLGAVPNPEYSFTGWRYNGAIISTDPGFAFPVTAHATLTAVFEQVQTDVDDVAAGRPDVRVFPNPASGSIQVDVAEPENVKGIFFANLLGQRVSSMRYAGAQHERIRLDVTRLMPGIYFLVVEFDGSRVVRKVIIQ